MGKRHLRADERIRSTRNLVKSLRKMRGITDSHRRTMLRHALFLLTEAEWTNKYKTRFCSKTALTAAKEKLRHDHVFPRAKMVDALLQSSADSVDDILNDAVGCTITIDEHALLNKFEDFDGWERYRKAGITVIDTATGKALHFKK